MSARDIRVAYHLLDARNWHSFTRHGLLSARHLMAAGGQESMAREYRPTGRQLTFEGAVIRDQRPMPPHVLARCLTGGLSPEDWYGLVNSKVFFWLDPPRLNRQRLACRALEQIVLVFDATRLLAKHGAQASVTPINTGNAMRAAARRGVSTFVPYERWRVDAWIAEVTPGARPRPPAHRPVELTIADAVPDARRHVVRTVNLGAGETFDATD